MPCRATQDRWVMVESSDKMWSTGEKNNKPLQYSCLKNAMNCVCVCVCVCVCKTMKINQVVDSGIYIDFARKQYSLEK